MESIDGGLPSSVLGSDRRFQNSSFGIQNALNDADHWREDAAARLAAGAVENDHV